MNDINLRPAVLADLDKLEFMHQQIVEEERPFGDTIKNEDVCYYNLEELIMSSDSQVLVAEYEGKVVASGYAKIIPSKDYYIHKHHAYLGFMYTLPEMRGKGINGMILDQLKNWCKSQGIFELRLEVYLENEKAIKSYTKAGFLPNLLEMRMSIE